jgi:aminoglycoside phosphotransferase (APT) family kinase protein
VALTVERDLDELRSGIERWLGHPVSTVHRSATGYSCETVIVDAQVVIRLPPLADGIFPAYDLDQQAAVQEAVRAAGVPVAGPCRVEHDESFLGAPFVVMPFVDGPIPAEVTRTDGWLAGLGSDADRRAVWEGFVDVVVAVHQAASGGLGLRAGLHQELAAWEGYVAWSTDGAPPGPLAEVLAWCRVHLPADAPPSGLLWGDVRLGNVIFDPATLRPAAVLDWDMASVGPFELDLGWFLALEAVQAELLPIPVPGFGDRDEVVARAEAGLGRGLRDLRWYEVFALARASAISTRISVLQARAGRRPMFAPGHDPTIERARRLIEG